MTSAIDEHTQNRLVELGYDAAQIDALTPEIAAAIVTTTGLPVTVMRFPALDRPEVEEVIETTWDAFLSALDKEPRHTFAGKFAEPGWSAVEYSPPYRSKDNAKRSFALILDYDKGATFQDAVALWRDYYGLVYTTKSHGIAGDDGKLSEHTRVVLPLQRPVKASEHEQLWDWAAARSEDFRPDPQAKDISRFWYDTTLPPGGWHTERLRGRPLNPDAVIAAAPKIRVVQPAGPLSSDERIHRARSYLAKIPGAVSGSGGHTTTFNAVAHMMFGFDLSADDTESLILSDYNPRCDPPWSDREIKHKVTSVARRCTRPRGYLLDNDRPRITTTQQAAHRAPDIDLEVDWQSLLLVNKERNPRREFHNTLVFVRHHPEYRGKWSMDMRTETPWFDDAPLRTSMISDIRSFAGQRLGYTPGEADVGAAIVKAAEDRPFHPIQQYLRSLDWDGTPRLADMASRYLGSDDPLHAEMVRKFMIGAAARVLWPGCKLDTALMLTGPQGIRKSTFFAVLGGEWHADSFLDINNKDSFLQLHSAWIYELSELENVMTERAESRLKAWMTSTHDMYRAPYQKTVIRRPRAVVLCGTTNRQRFLTDDSGSRRFWIVPVCRRIATELLAEVRDQLWAEAACAAESGEPWWMDAQSEAAREDANQAHAEEDPWQVPLAAYLEHPHVDMVTSSALMVDVLKLEVARQDRAAQMRVSRVLQRLGWDRVQVRDGERRHWVYRRVVGDANGASHQPIGGDHQPGENQW